MEVIDSLLIETEADKAWKRTAKQKSLSSARHSYSIESIKKCEPRIAYINDILVTILGSVTLTKNGKPLKVNGFKLRHLDHWLEDGNIEAEEIFQFLSHSCAVRCEFCYLRGSPDNAVTQFNHLSQDEIEQEIDFRLRLIEQNKRIFTPTFHTEEVIGHKLFRNVATRLRELTQEVFILSTAGYSLTDETIDFLKLLKPVEVRISLNTVNEVGRFRFMRDRSNVVLTALKRLKEENLRYTVSLVVWPSMKWEEIEETIVFASQFSPHAIYAILPGYTKQFSEKQLFDTSSYWNELTVKLVELRCRVKAPIIIHPRLFEQIALGSPTNEAKVIGITEGSPAAYSGLKVNDVIKGIEGRYPIRSLRELDTVLQYRHHSRSPRTSLVVERESVEFDVVIDTEFSYSNSYHSQPPYNDLLGLHLISQGIALSDIGSIYKAAYKKNAKIVAVSTSVIVLNSFIEAISQFSALYEVDGQEIEIVPFIAPNNYYGGNICLSELNTVSDIEAGILELVSIGVQPDLVLIPSPPFNPGGWWRDISGVPFTRLRNRFDFDIELLICSPFE